MGKVLDIISIACRREICNVYIKNCFKTFKSAAVQSTALGIQVPYPPRTASLTPEDREKEEVRCLN